MKTYFCPDGKYNDMATLLFNSQEDAIKQLFHLDGKISNNYEYIESVKIPQYHTRPVTIVTIMYNVTYVK